MNQMQVLREMRQHCKRVGGRECGQPALNAGHPAPEETIEGPGIAESNQQIACFASPR